MKSISIVLHKRPALAVNWETLIQNNNNNDALILVCSKSAYASLSLTERNFPAEILLVDEFSFDTLQPLLSNVLERLYEEGDVIRIANLAEFDMTLLGELRDYFRAFFKVEGPGQAVISHFRDKLAMKSILGAQDVRLPKYQKFNPVVYQGAPSAYIKYLEEELGYPMFAKPTDSGGSIGTAYIKDREALVALLDKIKDSAQPYEIDEFIEGDLYHCDSVIQNGKPQFTFVSKYLHPNADARSGAVLGSITMNPETNEYKELAEFAESALSKFPRVPDGFTHLEVFKKKNGELIFLEVAARPPGGKVAKSYKIRTNGIDIYWLHLRLQLGFNIDEQLIHLRDASKWGPFAAMYQLVAPNEEGVIDQLIEPTFKSSHYIFEPSVGVGDVVSPNESLLDTIVSTVFWDEDYEKLLADFYSLDEQNLVEITPVRASSISDYVCAKASDLTADICNAAYRFGKWVVTDNEAYFPKNKVLLSQHPATLFSQPNTCPIGANNAAVILLPQPLPVVGR